MRRVLLVPCLVLLAGCTGRSDPTVQPEQTTGAVSEPLAKQEPAAAVKSTPTKAAPAKAGEPKSASAPTGDVPAAWIRTFNDAQLTELVQEALTSNRDLAPVAAHLEQAQARARQAEADLAPTVVYAAGAAGNDAAIANDLSKGVGAGLSLRWEAELWGRLGSTDAAIAALAQADALDQRSARESLAANVAKALFLARLTTAQDAISRDVLAEQDKLVKSLEAAKASDADTAAAKAELNEVLQRLTQASAAREEAVRSLELLLGRRPSGELVTGDKLPEPPGPPPSGLPSQVLERRPDLVAATRRVALAFHQNESTKAARLPRLPLTVGGGSASSDLQRMNADGAFWSAISNLVGPLYDGGRQKERVVIEAGAQQEALAAFGQAGLQAFRQVENSLGRSARLLQRASAATETLTIRTQALTTIDGRKQAGEVGEEAVVRARLQVLQAKALMQALTADQLSARVDLFLALGGGFDAPVPSKDDLAQPPTVEVR